jgi:gliding motility-associated-like protein
MVLIKWLQIYRGLRGLPPSPEGELNIFLFRTGVAWQNAFQPLNLKVDLYTRTIALNMKIIPFILFQLLVCLGVCRAQLCTGSLGDPVVHKTFGSGGNPGPALAVNAYNFISADCPPDGSYTVRNTTANCFSNSWYSLTEDHTPGDANGYFMLVNASFQPGDFYVDTIRGLCTNTTYEFAAWVINVLKPSACGNNGIDPNLTFNIETPTGTVLATYSTNNIPEDFAPAWKQYGLFFQTPAATTSVVVRITNNAPGGCGNDIALDDITFRPCGPLVNAALSITGDTTAQLCEGDPASLVLGSSHSAGYSSPIFQWQVSKNGSTWSDIPGENNTSFTRGPTGVGTWRYRLTMAELTNAASVNCRVASNIVSVIVNPLPNPQLRDTTAGCEGKDVVLQALDGNHYSWTGPDNFISSLFNPTLPAVQPTDAGMYYVTALSDKGCTQKDSTWLVVNPAVIATTGNGGSICEGSSITLHASGGVRYVWTPASGLSSTTLADPVASPADTTTYQATVYNQYGCSDTASVTINIWEKPVANAGPDKRTIEGTPVELNGTVKGTSISYSWSQPLYMDNPALLQPDVNPPRDITYTLTAVSDLGCGISRDNVFVRVYKQVKVPNAFSPNGDGINDVWDIVNLSTYPEAATQVFDRQGQLIWQSNGYNRPWNGTYNGRIIPVGTYYYTIDLKTDVFPKMSGWVFVVR